MELIYSQNKIVLNDKILSKLDRFVFGFTNILDNHAKYVIISGYVAILFGRNRASEDVDMFVEPISFGDFKRFWNDLEGYECHNSNEVSYAYEYLIDGLALRFSKKGEFIPNIEFKFAKKDLDRYDLDNRIEVCIDNERLFVGPIELQIAYKLFLGSEKDIEDARFLFKLFNNYIDAAKLEKFLNDIRIRPEIRKYLN